PGFLANLRMLLDTATDDYPDLQAINNSDHDNQQQKGHSQESACKKGLWQVSPS
ncbi:unnamed protein product, partial [Ilex paraguariensis]